MTKYYIRRLMTISVVQIVLLSCAAFLAGFVDAIVGGGGLIQTPSAMVLLPAFPVSSVVASLKLPSFSGTTLASFQYIKRISINWRLVIIICTISFFASFAGSELLTMVSNRFMKPVLLVILALVAIYTFLKKDFGQTEHVAEKKNNELILAIMISLIIGFYDGFIGPGAGSFFILSFISFLGFDFIKASANAKLANMATNLGSITLFLLHSKIIWTIAIPMSICNAAGGIIGANVAISKGNRFIRGLFLLIVLATLLRFSYDVFIK